MTVGQYNRHDIQLTADMPINANFLTTLSASSQTQDGYQHVVPYPSNSTIGQNAFMVMGQADMPKAPGSHSSGDGGGKNIQALRGKVLIHASGQARRDVSGDWTHENQSGLANTVMGVFTSNQTATSIRTAPAPAPVWRPADGQFLQHVHHDARPRRSPGRVPFNTTNGLCGPLGVGTWNSSDEVLPR